MQPPLSGDEAALKKYADQMEALRKQVLCFTTLQAPHRLRAAVHSVAL